LFTFVELLELLLLLFELLLEPLVLAPLAAGFAVLPAA